MQSNEVNIPKKVKNITGETFNRLIVIKYVGNNNHHIALWETKCVCGKIKIISGKDLRNGKIQSCGCLQKECVSNINKKHNLCKHPLYGVWCNVVGRCTNSNSPDWKYYGGRNIKISKDWLNFTIFYNDVIDLWKEGLQIDRIDNNGDYKKGNVRFVTPKNNCRNTRRNKIIEINGITKPLCQWSEESGIKRNTISKRLKSGYIGEELLKPVKSK